MLAGCDLSQRDQLGLARLVDLLSHRHQPQP
jgi:hypothetical protein